MMHDNLDPHVSGYVEPAKGERAEIRDESVIDREVPVAGASMPAIIHAWLDGEPVNEPALQAAGSYPLWRRVQTETGDRRRMQAPATIRGAIMEAIRKEG